MINTAHIIDFAGLQPSWLMFVVCSDHSDNRQQFRMLLEELGALALTHGHFLLPDSHADRGRLASLLKFIAGTPNDIVVLRANVRLPQDARALIGRFNAQCDRRYAEFLAASKAFEQELRADIDLYRFMQQELAQEDSMLDRLRRRIACLERIDFFHSPLASEARESLRQCEALLAPSHGDRRLIDNVISDRQELRSDAYHSRI